jgi:hypothetical protein
MAAAGSLGTNNWCRCGNSLTKILSKERNIFIVVKLTNALAVLLVRARDCSPGIPDTGISLHIAVPKSRDYLRTFSGLVTVITYIYYYNFVNKFSSTIRLTATSVRWLPLSLSALYSSLHSHRTPPSLAPPQVASRIALIDS